MVMFAVLLLVLIGAARQTGWLPIVALVIASASSIYLYHGIDRRSRPELWAVGGWLATQIPLGVGIAITGGPRSPALAWLAIAVVSLVARFNRATIRAGMLFLYLLLVVDTFGVDASWTAAHPASVLGVAALMFCVWIFSEALMRSDLDQRTHDAVTGLVNLEVFLSRVREVLSNESRDDQHAVLVVELSEIGVARESFGPRAANALLSQAGARIARTAASAELVGKGYGDEFLILLSPPPKAASDASAPDSSDIERGARRLAESLKSALTEPFAIGSREVCLNCYTGIALFAGDARGSDPEQAAERLLADAQLALSSAREAGPGGVALYDPSKPRAARRLSVVPRLRRAIEHGELELHYQPTVDVRTGRIVGVEALARWVDEELGTVSPAEFIPVAEETGLIHGLGQWVFEEVARQAREWERQGMRFEVAFNLSPRQLSHPELLKHLTRRLDSAGVPRERFIVEITESSALRDFESTVRLLANLRSNGYRIAIDDFGVELSSLSRLLEIPTDVLKIDRSFVSALSRQPNAGVMVKTIIELADRLGLRSHAEGVEQEEERRFLVASGCDLAQGYLFSKPVPAAEIARQYESSLYVWPVRLTDAGKRAA